MRLKTRLVFSLIMLLMLALAAYPVSAAYQKVFVIELEYDKGVITNSQPYVTPVYFNREKVPEAGYAAKLVSVSGERLYEVKFDFPLVILYLVNDSWFDKSGRQIFIPDEPSRKMRDNASVQLYFPHSGDAKSVNVYGPDGQQLLSIDVAYLSRYCGDRICDEGESCEKDCGAEKLLPLVAVQPKFSLIYAIAILLIVSVMAFLLFRWKVQGQVPSDWPAQYRDRYYKMSQSERDAYMVKVRQWKKRGKGRLGI